MEHTKFNSGKMSHIFQIRDNLYLPDFTNDEAKKALENGRFFYKIDGQNGAIIKEENGDLLLVTRYDDKKGKLNPLELPKGYLSLSEGNNRLHMMVIPIIIVYWIDQV